MTKSKTVLVTGASSGIGYELARLFAHDKYNVVLVARRIGVLRDLCSTLENKYKIQALAIEADLADPAAPAKIQAQVEEEGIVIDVLVNNAGIGAVGPFSMLDLGHQMNMLQINVNALTDLSRRFLPAMKERQTGGIINVASVAAFQPGPFMAVYYATKAYVLSFSEAIASELEGSGLTVTCVCPGATVTEFEKTAGADKMFRSLPAMTALSVAKLGYAGFKRGERVVVTGLLNRLIAQTSQITPHGISVRIARFINN